MSNFTDDWGTLVVGVLFAVSVLVFASAVLAWMIVVWGN